MPEKILMHNDSELLTYNKLIDFINSADSYRPVLKTPCIFDFILNFILALSAGKNIALLDSDLSEAEILSLGESDTEKKSPLPSRKKLSCIEELIDLLSKSQSQITVYTSGTTGLPKKVCHSLAGLARYVRKSPDYAMHIWGFSYNPTHMAGLQVLLQIIFNQNTSVNLFMKAKNFVYVSIEKYSITHISATPTFYRLLLPQEKTYPSIKRITLGGEKSDSKLYENLLKVFPNAKINNIYASTEGGSLLASSGEFFKIPESMSDKIRICDDELLIHKELLGGSESLVLEGDFYKTGDMIQWVDEEKKLFKFLSRKSNLVNVGGYKVNIEEIEDYIRQLTQVTDVVVYGRKNSILGNILCADIKLNTPDSLSIADVRNFLSEHLQQFKIPRKIEFTDSITSTRSGKIKR